MCEKKLQNGRIAVLVERGGCVGMASGSIERGKRMLIGIITALSVMIAMASAAHISVVPAFQSVGSGENFTINIYIDPEGSEVYGAQYDLYFNNSLFNATYQCKGDFLSQDGASTIVYKNEIDNETGIVKYAEARTGTTSGVTSPGILATITFEAIGEYGVGDFILANVKLSDPSANPIPTNISNGTVRIGICGDVDNSGEVTMSDGRQIWMNIIYGADEYPIESEWAADVDCDGEITMADGRQIWMNIIYGADEYPLNCCG